MRNIVFQTATYTRNEHLLLTCYLYNFLKINGCMTFLSCSHCYKFIFHIHTLSGPTIVVINISSLKFLIRFVKINYTFNNANNTHNRCSDITCQNLETNSLWWTRRGSNPRPLRCERSALPTELRALLHS